MEVKNIFQDFANYLKEGNADVAGVPCDKCSSYPCDWITYGPEISAHLNEKYVGLFIDNDGNVGDQSSGSSSIVKNSHLQYLAYCTFSSAKHGYLGKNKRIPLPHCVQMGIRANYPDKCDVYVGFQYAKEKR